MIEEEQVQLCSDCRYWHEGRCFRYPPVPLYEPPGEPTYYYPGGLIYIRPRVKETDTCGEWKPLMNEQEREARMRELERMRESEEEQRQARRPPKMAEEAPSAYSPHSSLGTVVIPRK